MKRLGLLVWATLFVCRWLAAQELAGDSVFEEHRPFNLAPEDLPLPPLAALLPRIESAPITELRSRVEAIRFRGNRKISSQELAEVVAPYTGRTITAGELEAARLAITARYVERGYVTSGATLEDQDIKDGIVTFTIVEGSLAEIQVEGNRWLRSQFISRRLQRRGRDPLNINPLKDELALLSDHPVIARLNSDLQPTADPAHSRLIVHVNERFPIHLALEVNNDRPASVGGEHLDLIASDQSLTRNGDALNLRLGLLERSKNGAENSGFDNLAISYELPLSSWETTLRLAYTQNDYSVIEEPFAELAIDSRSRDYEVTLRQPIYRTFQSELALFITGSQRHSETFLRDRPFTFSPGAVDGKTDVTVLRVGPEWTYRTQSFVLALRSSFHFGFDSLNSTDDGTDRDGQFFAWLGQMQYVQRLGRHGAQFILRGDFQWTDDQLLSLEQVSIGGHGTVRGYRENQLVRDRGVVGSAELRVPIWLSGRGKPIVQVAGFYDIGAGWNVGERTPEPKYIHSAGVGLLVNAWERLTAEIYWAYAFTDIPDFGERDLQDCGLHFRVSTFAF
ncbi:MAG: hypothetical protein QOE70_4694 [Chthoniobacter sp.]|nr:hypothetical protein [Chthoniobacter sp.]